VIIMQNVFCTQLTLTYRKIPFTVIVINGGTKYA
jgi:hypothetical protein